MQAKDLPPSVLRPQLNMLDMIEQGLITGITRLTIDQVETEHGWIVQSLAIGSSNASRASLPVVIIDQHPDDCAAMKYAVSIFEALKSRGFLTSDQVAQYRRALITLVPPLSTSCRT